MTIRDRVGPSPTALHSPDGRGKIAFQRPNSWPPRRKTAVYHWLGYDLSVSATAEILGGWQRTGSGIWRRDQILLHTHLYNHFYIAAIASIPSSRRRRGRCKGGDFNPGSASSRGGRDSSAAGGCRSRWSGPTRPL